MLNYLNHTQLQEIEPESIWIELTPVEIADVNSISAQAYSNPTGLSHAQRNQLCLNKLQAWLVEHQIPHSPSFTSDELTTIWDVVNGCAIEIGKTRLILIPTESSDRDEISIPQEWVDLPNWVGDYYLGVQLDLAVGLMNIWGFASHQTIKTKGEYQPLDRTYTLDSDSLVNNLDLLWLADELALNERVEIESPPQLSLDIALDLIQQISNPSPYSPRLDLPVAEWAAILNNPTLRAQLYQTRRQRAAISQVPTPSFRLWDWVQDEFANTITSGWQKYQPALGITRNTTTIEQTKLINLQLDLQQETVVLLIGVIPESSERIRILVQVHPSGGSRCLPPHLQLSYVDEHGAILRTVTARSNDNCIQLPGYTCQMGTEFSIQLQLANDRIIERFVV